MYDSVGCVEFGILVYCVFLVCVVDFVYCFEIYVYFVFIFYKICFMLLM